MLDYRLEAITNVKVSSDVQVSNCCAISASFPAQVPMTLCSKPPPPHAVIIPPSHHSGIIALKRHLSRTKRHLCLSVLYNYDLHFLENRLKAWLRGMFESSAGWCGVGGCGVQAGGWCALVGGAGTPQHRSSLCPSLPLDEVHVHDITVRSFF